MSNEKPSKDQRRCGWNHSDVSVVRPGWRVVEVGEVTKPGDEFWSTMKGAIYWYRTRFPGIRVCGGEKGKYFRYNDLPY